MGVNLFLKIRVQRNFSIKRYIPLNSTIRPFDIPSIRIMYHTGGVSDF